MENKELEVENWRAFQLFNFSPSTFHFFL